MYVRMYSSINFIRSKIYINESTYVRTYVCMYVEHYFVQITLREGVNHFF